MAIPCPKCGRLYTFDGNRCCNKYCRFGSTNAPKIDFKAVRRERFLTEGGLPAVAAWVPVWYELDPPLLEVGLTEQFVFWRIVPDHLRGEEPLVLYTGLRGQLMDVAWGTVSAIYQPELGAIRSVNTRGLDYNFLLVNGEHLVVDAEEAPGQFLEQREEKWIKSERKVYSWRFTVEFSALAKRVPAELHADDD
jgi:hypothetical protein